MNKLYFCRHGESEANATQTFAGQLDTPLTDRGRDQAIAAGESARNLQIDCIVSSPLVRAHETARIIASTISYPETDVVVSELCVERYLGALQGQPYSMGPEDPAVYPDIETSEELLVRAQKALAYLHTLTADTVLLVAHGSFGIALKKAITPGDYEEMPNAEIVQLI